MRVLLLVNNGFEAGGAEKSVKLIKSVLIEEGHQVLVVSTDADPKGMAVFSDVQVPAIRGSAYDRLVKHAWNSPTYKKIKSVVTSFNPDIVHFHTISEFSPCVFWAVQNKPTIMTVHGPEEFTNSLIPWLLPASDYRQGSYRKKDMTMTGTLRYDYYRYIQSPIYRLGTKKLKLFVAPSQYIEHVLHEEMPKIPVRQLYNGIAMPHQSLVLERDIQNVLYVGRLESVKGVDYLIVAFAETLKRFPNAMLTIVGDGSQKLSLHQLAVSLGLHRQITFTGWLSPQETLAMYEKSAIVVIPSIWPENLPTVGIEALAVGRAIIGSNTGGISELIENNRNGYLFPPRDTTDMATAMEALLANPNAIRSMGQVSHEKAEQFEIKHFVAQLTSLYNEIL